jgi:hypothetical protein
VDNKPEWEEHLSAPPADGFTPQLMRRIAEQSRKRRASGSRAVLPAFRLASLAAGLAIVIALLVGKEDIVRYFSGAAAGISDAAGHYAPGEGGELAWWQKKKAAALTKEEQTIAGAVVSIMTRDIGTFGRKAGIDAYFDPAALHLKDLLADYDASSPRLTEAYVLDQTADSEGTSFLIKTVLTTAIPDDPSYEGSFTMHVNRASGKIDALSVEKAVERTG